MTLSPLYRWLSKFYFQAWPWSWDAGSNVKQAARRVPAEAQKHTKCTRMHKSHSLVLSELFTTLKLFWVHSHSPGTNLTRLTVGLRTPHPGLCGYHLPFWLLHGFCGTHHSSNCAILPASRLHVSSLLFEIQFPLTGRCRSGPFYPPPVLCGLIFPLLSWSPFHTSFCMDSLR